jgi:predicted Zn-dependent protease
VVENEAQLAAVVGHEIAHATQEHQCRQMNYHKNAKIALSIASAVVSAYGARNLADIANMAEGAIRNGYQRSLEIRPIELVSNILCEPVTTHGKRRDFGSR